MESRDGQPGFLIDLVEPASWETTRKITTRMRDAAANLFGAIPLIGGLGKNIMQRVI